MDAGTLRDIVRKAVTETLADDLGLTALPTQQYLDSLTTKLADGLRPFVQTYIDKAVDERLRAR